MRKRLLGIVTVLLCSLTLIAADDGSTTRLDRVGHKLVCQCGCGQILMECNHVGCPVSGPMIDELRAQLAATPAQAESAVLAWFTNKYGAIVLAAPIRGGFDVVAWIVPFAILALGAGAIFLVLRRWKQRYAVAHAADAAAPLDDAQRRRIRDEIDG